MRDKNNMMLCFMQRATDSEPYELYLYDEVKRFGDFNWETWNYEDSETSANHFRDVLNEIPDGSEIHLHINSVGGEVGEGVTIYNLLRQKSQAGSKLIGFVDGMAYSVAMDIAMACDEIHMGLGTSMLLHFPWRMCAGNAEQLRSYADQLDALGDASVQLYMARATIDETELREMMQKETMLDPETCLKYGFCDVVDQYRAQDPEEPEDPEDPETDPEDPEGMKQRFLQMEETIRSLKQKLEEKEKKPSMVDTLKQSFEILNRR